MAQTLAQITKQIEMLQKQADALRQSELKGVVDRIKVAISHYGLTPDQLGFGTTAGKSAKIAKVAVSGAKKSAAPRFANEEGQVWSGRGPRPHWLRDALANGRSLEDFSTDMKKRSPKAAAVSKQIVATADIAAPVKEPVAAKRTKVRAKLGAKQTVIAPIPALPSSDPAPAKPATASVAAPKVPRKAKASPAKLPRTKKAPAAKAAPAAVKSAPQSKVKRTDAVAATAKKTAAAPGGEKASAGVTAPVEA